MLSKGNLRGSHLKFLASDEFLSSIEKYHFSTEFRQVKHEKYATLSTLAELRQAKKFLKAIRSILRVNSNTVH